MKKRGGVLALAILLILAPACASTNPRQAAIEGGAGAVIGGVLGFAVGTTLGHPNTGARIGAAIGATTGATHGLFNRDEEILAKEQQTQEALALSNRALAQVLERQSAPSKPSITASSTMSSAKPKPLMTTTPPKRPSTKNTVAPNAVALCKCDEVEVYNAASFGIRAKAGPDPTGVFVPAQTPICLPQGRVFVRSETIPPSAWLMRDPGMARRMIIQDSDF